SKREAQALTSGSTITFHRVELVDDKSEPIAFHSAGSDCHLLVELTAHKAIETPRILVGIDDLFGQRHLTVQTPLSNAVATRLAGKHRIRCRIPRSPLPPGEYTVTIQVLQGNYVVERTQQALAFSVLDGDLFGEG